MPYVSRRREPWGGRGESVWGCRPTLFIVIHYLEFCVKDGLLCYRVVPLRGSDKPISKNYILC